LKRENWLQSFTEHFDTTTGMGEAFLRMLRVFAQLVGCSRSPGLVVTYHHRILFLTYPGDLMRSRHYY